MNKDDLIKKLENLDLPEVELASHQRRLKMALLNSGYWKGETTMSLLKKRIVPVGGIIAIAAIVVVFSFTFKGTTPQVSAQEMAQKIYRTVANLPSEQQEKLKHTIGVDARDLLQEAQDAEDLEVLTYDEFVSQYPVPADPEGKLQTLRFLRFTNADGWEVVLGIDQDNLPSFGSVRGGDAPIFGSVGPGPEVGELDERFEGADDGPSTVEVINGERFINGVKVTPQE